MTYNPQQRARRQSHRRKTRSVKRLEIVLSGDNPRDQAIFDYLASLPSRGVSEFIRSAISEKIERRSTPKPAPPDPAKQIVAMLSELGRKIDAVTIPPSGPIMAPAASAPVPIASSGLDLSAPRRPRVNRPAASAPPAPPPDVPFDADDARKKLLASINAYGSGQGSTPAPVRGG